MIIFLCQLCGNICYRTDLYSSEGDCPAEDCKGTDEDLVAIEVDDDEDLPEAEFVGGIYEFKRKWERTFDDHHAETWLGLAE